MLLADKILTLKKLQQLADSRFGNLVKAVVDIDNNLLVVDAEMHADEEQFLLARGSRQSSLWGINLYPEKFGTTDFIEFDSMINLRPAQNNLSRGVEDAKIREKIVKLVETWIKP